MNGIRRLRLEYSDGVKFMVLRDRPAGYADFLGQLAAKVPAVEDVISGNSLVVRLRYKDPESATIVNVDDDDDLEVMLMSPYDSLTISMTFEEMCAENRHRAISMEAIAQAQHNRKSSISSASAYSAFTSRSIDPSAMAAAHPPESRPLDSRSSSGSSTAVMHPPTPASAMFMSQVPTPTLQGPIPTSGEWDLLMASKSTGPWYYVQLNLTREHVHRVSTSWERVKSRGGHDSFAKSVLAALVEQNEHYAKIFPNRLPALAILDGLAAQAESLARGDDQTDTVAEILQLGANHKTNWRVGPADLKCMTSAIIHALATHPTAQTTANDLLAWRSLLCEMAGVMARGCSLTADELSAVNKRAEKAKKSKEKCRIM